MQYKLIIFDADGTLAERDTGELLPGVRAYFRKFARLGPDARSQIAIATNQGGVGMRHQMESGGWGEPAKYPTQEQIEKAYPQRMRNLLEEIPHRLYIAYAFQDRRGRWSPVPPGQEQNPRWGREWRKPSPGMLLQAMADAEVPPAETLMVGDREDDRLAAQRAGCHFQWAADFFAPYTGQGSAETA
jgi:HAD superfamily hydrolase (TIGR01662 family)